MSFLYGTTRTVSDADVARLFEDLDAYLAFYAIVRGV